MLAQTREHWGLPAAASSYEKDMGQFSLRASGGTNLAHSLVLDFWPPQPTRMNFCHLKLPGVWQLVIAALGNQSTWEPT